jgi:hypothetical protein
MRPHRSRFSVSRLKSPDDREILPKRKYHGFDVES